MTELRYHEAAEAELLREVGYLESRERGLGRRLLVATKRAERLVLDFPEGSTEIRPGLRRRLIPPFRLSLIYANEPDGPLVLAVAHASRRPDYWSSRIAGDRPT